MNLSKFSDYAFRILIYLAKNQERLCTVEELASNLQISEHHLKKIVHKLAKTEYITSIKGRNGGLRLGIDPYDINLGKVLLITEDNLTTAACFSSARNECAKDSNCKFKCILGDALTAFVKEISKHTLQELL